MRSNPLQRARLALLLTLSIVPVGCAPTLAKLNPPVADLAVEKKPVMPVEAITDDTVAAQYSSDVEGWGDRGWAAVARLCRWAQANKMPHPECLAP